MSSLIELVERVNKGEIIEANELEVYEDSANVAEKFLAHHAHATLDLRRAQQHLVQSLEAIDYGDQKILNQFISISGSLGYSDLRTAPVVRFGAAAIARKEWALAIEAIQNALAYDLAHGGSFCADRDNTQYVSAQYERAALALGWTSPVAAEATGKQIRIAYIVSGISDDDAATKSLRALARYHDSKRFRVHVYSTETSIKRDKQQFAQSAYLPPSSRRGAKTIDYLTRQKIAVWNAPADGDSVSAAKELANQLAKDRIDVAIFDTNVADPIAALVACWPVSRAKMNLVRTAPLHAGAMHVITYFNQRGYEADKSLWQKKNVPSRFILEGIDLEEDLGPAPQRAAYGIPEQAIVLATSGNNIDSTMSGEFTEIMINILRSHTHGIYLLIGEGELAWQKRKFDAAGVGKRVGYAGARKDMPGFLRMADIYLCEVPAANTTGLLQAMAMERSVVAAKWADTPEAAEAATLAGAEATVAGRDQASYIDRVGKLIRDANYRQKLGKLMRQRIEQHFSFAQTTRHIEQLCEQLTGKSEPTAPAEGDNNELLAEVA